MSSGVASVALRSLAHAAEPLTDRREQEEVLQIFDKINKETGWRIGFIYKELKEKWGWNQELSPYEFAQTHTAARQAKEAQDEQQRQQLQTQQNMQLQQGFDFAQQQQAVAAPPRPPQPPPPQQQPTPAKKPPSGIPNPMYAKADFNLPQHPYQNFYVAPNSFAHQQQQQQGGQMYYNF